MKSRLYRFSILSLMLGVLPFNFILADDAAISEVRSDVVTVSYDDLNLANPAGLDSLYRRIRFAANDVCGVENMRVSLDVVRKNRECVAGSIESAIGQIGDARLTALHKTKLMELQHS